MKPFMDDNFLLDNGTAQKLYHEYAKAMPIFDYHCHVSPKEIAENKRYTNITELWLSGDHYKWRALRINGIDEKYITGDASDKEKFLKWAETMPHCIGNPMYHWTHLELKRFFNIDKLLGPHTAEEIWHDCNVKLKTSPFTTRELINRSHVKALCTTDDPVDSLCYHKQIAEDNSFNVKVLPTFRPDKFINIEQATFLPWIKKLSETTKIAIKELPDFLNALKNRLNYFNSHGCRLSDHSLEPIVFEKSFGDEVNVIFKKALNHEPLTPIEINKFKTKLMLFLGENYSDLGWCMQLHLGATRNPNKKRHQQLGPDTGFDCIGNAPFSHALIAFLSALDYNQHLPKTILYTLNPIHEDLISSIVGSFQGDGIPGKIQFGSAWWFNDHKTGIIKQMTALGNMGLLSRFVGMLTDSRSFLSYTRHEYFRRILCNLIGTWVEKGEVPNDIPLLGEMVQNISYHNAIHYFNI
jgi:glucuronate isomerase